MDIHLFGMSVGPDLIEELGTTPHEFFVPVEARLNEIGSSLLLIWPDLVNQRMYVLMEGQPSLREQISRALGDESDFIAHMSGAWEEVYDVAPKPMPRCSQCQMDFPGHLKGCPYGQLGAR